MTDIKDEDYFPDFAQQPPAFVGLLDQQTTIPYEAVVKRYNFKQ